ncbi:MAG: NADH:ubiquinone reductase (Na(+)-transporting) subunit D [Chlamydiales bacterium]
MRRALRVKREPLSHYFTEPLWHNNQILVAILGICSALAVTTTLSTAITMGISVSLVTGFSCYFVSLFRKFTPDSVRMITQLAIISSLVIIVDQFLQAYFFNISKTLSVFVGLIITNCIVMGRLEAYAMANKPWPSFLDGIGNGLGYGVILMILAVVRELFGSGGILKGTPFHWEVFKSMGINYTGNGLLLLPAGACFLLGIIIWVQRALNGHRETH